MTPNLFTPYLCFALTFAATALAQNPINDGSSNTLLLTERVGSYSDQGGSKATAEYGEPDVAAQPAKNTVWYRYVAPVKGRIIIDIKDDQGLRADLRRPGNPPGTLPIQQIVDGTSNTIAFDEERLSTDLERGGTVYLRVDAEEPFDFSWRFVEAINDFYQDALFADGASGTIKANDTGATLSAYEKNLGLDRPGVWFLWTAPSTGQYSFDLVGSHLRSSQAYNSFSLRAYATQNRAPGGLITAAVGNTTTNDTVISLSAVAGQSYYFLCHGDELAADNQIWFSWYPHGSSGVITWAQSTWYGSEATGFAPTQLLRLRGATGSLAFGFDTAPSGGLTPATSNSDYGNSAIGINLSEGVRSAGFGAPILQDSQYEPDEDYLLMVVGSSVENVTSRVIIKSDDGDGAAGFTSRTIRVKEGETAYLPVARLRPGTDQFYAGWKIGATSGTPGVDWETGSGQVVLPADGTSNTIQFPTVQDGAFEGDEYVTIELVNSLGPIFEDARSVTVIIEDDDYFVPRAGKYCGIIDTNGYGALVKYKVTDLGSATGSVQYRGVKYSFTGKFDAVGSLVTSLPRQGGSPLGLRLKFGEGWLECAASLRDPDGVWADGSVRLLPYNGTTAIAPQAGRFTVLCEGDTVDVPFVMTGRVFGDGSVRFIGKMADKTAVTCGGFVGQADASGIGGGEFAFYSPLYGAAGNFYGTFDLGLGPQQPGGETNQWWLKPWKPKQAIYPALPFQACTGSAIRYTPANGTRVLDELNNTGGSANLNFAGGGTILDGTSNTILIGENNVASFPVNPNNCGLTINPKTGLFTGRAAPPNGPATTFYGVFLEGAENYGRGFWLGDGKAGRVVLDPD